MSSEENDNVQERNAGRQIYFFPPQFMTVLLSRAKNKFQLISCLLFYFFPTAKHYCELFAVNAVKIVLFLKHL